MTTRKEFEKKLRNHDWFYAYSDDHRYWTAGRDAESRLLDQHRELSCPYPLITLRKWAHNMILEQFAEEEPGEWYRQPRKYKCIAPTALRDLMTQAEHDLITDWFHGPRKPNEINHLEDS